MEVVIFKKAKFITKTQKKQNKHLLKTAKKKVFIDKILFYFNLKPTKSLQTQFYTKQTEIENCYFGKIYYSPMRWRHTISTRVSPLQWLPPGPHSSCSLWRKRLFSMGAAAFWGPTSKIASQTSLQTSCFCFCGFQLVYI